jgi:hypothetical protein
LPIRTEFDVMPVVSLNADDGMDDADDTSGPGLAVVVGVDELVDEHAVNDAATATMPTSRRVLWAAFAR